MIPELGQFSLILALCLSILLGTIPIVGAEKSNALWMSLARPWLRVSLCFWQSHLCCWHTHSSQMTFPSDCRRSVKFFVTDALQNHCFVGRARGSFLLWTFMLAGWMLAVSIYSKSMPVQFVARVLACWVSYVFATYYLCWQPLIRSTELLRCRL